MPKARSFQSIALTSPGVNQGDVEGGFQVNGASGAENSFTVDGVNTNSLLYGSSRQDTQFEYLQEVQVKTGGIAAEYGGALDPRYGKPDLWQPGTQGQFSIKYLF